jgi:hypothetical protein
LLPRNWLDVNFGLLFSSSSSSSFPAAAAAAAAATVKDTDSIILTGCSPHFSDLLKEKFVHDWPRINAFLFEDESNQREQSGLLKVITRCCARARWETEEEEEEEEELYSISLRSKVSLRWPCFATENRICYKIPQRPSRVSNSNRSSSNSSSSK